MKAAIGTAIAASLITTGLAMVSTAFLVGGCGGGPPGKFPPAKPGCAVAVFPEAPDAATENIGPVSANCAMDVSDADCLRTLQDQVCKLGGDVAWGVDEKPTLDVGRKRLSGRAAKRK